MISSRDLAIKKINQYGILLMFPINNQTTPQSIWSELYPRTKLIWKWDDKGDQKVFKMWQLMKELSCCREVIYSKWYFGRATFFSRELFLAMIRVLHGPGVTRKKISPEAQALLTELESDSPLSTRDLKKLTNLQGKLNQAFFNRGLKELFSTFLVVGFGEVEDGAFPSLAVGSTCLIYEELWVEAQTMELVKAQILVNRYMPEGSEIRKFFNKIKS